MIDKCNFYMIFIILLFIKIVSFPLFLLIFIYIYLFICALKEWEDFRLIYILNFQTKRNGANLVQIFLSPSVGVFVSLALVQALSPSPYSGIF